MKKIAIQGTLGSYHDIAAHKYFEGRRNRANLLCQLRRRVYFDTERQPGHRNARHRKYNSGKLVAQQ